VKVAIVGSGFVGSTAAYAIMMRRAASEIVLIDANEKRARAEAADIEHASPYVHPIQISASGFEGAAGASVVVLAAGASQKPGESRLMLMGRNAAILRDIITRTLAVNPDPIFLVATNPVDIITHLAVSIAAESGLPPGRVIGTGTTLDTARFRTLLGRHLGVDAQHVHAYVVGEHGDSEVLVWSNIDIGGVPLGEFARFRLSRFDREVREEIDRNVRNAAYAIIEGKGSTYYGIGGAIARLVEIIARDNRAVMTVSTRVESIEGVRDVTISMPHLLDGSGDQGILPIAMDVSEHALLRESARTLRARLDEVAGLMRGV
jgi:L-lactate dehydrogenase